MKVFLGERSLIGRVSSAGLCTAEGLPASFLAILAMKEQGIDISNHRSRQVNQSLVESSDHVVGITARHTEALLAQFPELSSRIRTFPFPDIPDPFGSDLESYRAVRDLLQTWSCRLLEWIEEEARGTD